MKRNQQEPSMYYKNKNKSEQQMHKILNKNQGRIDMLAYLILKK